MYLNFLQFILTCCKPTCSECIAGSFSDFRELSSVIDFYRCISSNKTLTRVSSLLKFCVPTCFKAICTGERKHRKKERKSSENKTYKILWILRKFRVICGMVTGWKISQHHVTAKYVLVIECRMEFSRSYCSVKVKPSYILS